MRRSRLPMRGAMLSAAVLLAISGSQLRAQEFEGVVTARVKGMPGGGDLKLFAKGGRARIEVTMPGGGASAIIIDPSAGETYMVMPAQSMYMVMKMSDAERMADSLIRSNTSGETSMTATGKHDEIAGYRCEYYRFQDAKSATDICLTMGLGALRAGMFAGGLPGRGRQETPAWVGELLRRGAFPLKVTDATGVIWEVVALEKKRIEASLFVPPADYRRMQMPGRPPQ